jgi:RHS repeat-associated protein
VASVSGFVNGVLNPVYTYDLDGNLTSGAGRTVTWTSFNMVATIVQGATTIAFGYDADHSRITQTEASGSSTTTTTYLNGPGSGSGAGAGVSAEKVVAGSVTTWTDYLFAAGARVGARSIVNGVVAPIKYYITDHLGSIAIVTNGTTHDRRSFDAWGKSRNLSGTDDPAGFIDLGHGLPTRGFTGHEHIPAVGLINMNARVYDPELGRFLSADSVVQSIYFSPALNRYAYVFNNPLSLADPTGNYVVQVIVITATNPVAAAVTVVASVFSAIFSGGLFGAHHLAIIRTAYIRPPSPPSPTAAARNPPGLPTSTSANCGVSPGPACPIEVTSTTSEVAANSTPSAATLASTGAVDQLLDHNEYIGRGNQPKGERGRTRRPSDEAKGKYEKPNPDRPGWKIRKDPQTGKTIDVPWPDDPRLPQNQQRSIDPCGVVALGPCDQPGVVFVPLPAPGVPLPGPVIVPGPVLVPAIP